MSSIKIPFGTDFSGKIAFTNDQNTTARQQITDVLVTSKGDRVMKPTYGANAMDLLFEPVDNLVFAEFRMDAIGELSRSLTGVSVQDLVVKPSDSNSFDDYDTTLEVAVRYSVGPLTKSSYSFSIGNASNFTEESSL
jgi:bisphosphoglycerate-independent phosphoglycerate mutase (AlkP superfamily)